MEKQPQIFRNGTIDTDIIETTPVVFEKELCLFQYVRKEYYANNTGDSYFRFIDPENGKVFSEFGHSLHLGSALEDGGRVVVFGVDAWGGKKIYMTESGDLQNWTKPSLVFEDPEMGAFNTSVCRGKDGKYIMACEQDRPEDEVGVRFTVFFLESNNLKDWKRCTDAPPFSKVRYTACPTLRFIDGKYYLFTLEGSYETFFAEYLYRSDDLINWEGSPFNPLLAPHRQDRHIGNEKLDSAQRKKMTEALNINNSDIDLCEFNGRTEIFYSWGNQRGREFLARATSPLPLEEFLKKCFES